MTSSKNKCQYKKKLAGTGVDNRRIRMLVPMLASSSSSMVTPNEKYPQKGITVI